MDSSMTQPAKLLLLANILARGGVITQNGKAFLKELILKKDPRLLKVLTAFDSEEAHDPSFLNTINRLIGEVLAPPKRGLASISRPCS